MTTSTLILPVSGEQDLASWAAVAFVASYSSPGTRQAYATQLRLWFSWCEQHHLDPLAGVRRDMSSCTHAIWKPKVSLRPRSH